MKSDYLNTSQRAMMAAALEMTYAIDAKKRQKESGKLGGRGNKNHSTKTREGKSSVKAAKDMNVSETSVCAAKTVWKFGSVALINAVRAGKVSVSRAAKIAKIDALENQFDIAMDFYLGDHQ